ncbi:MAG: hypothetical protein H6672_02010 [Anaerolineaceae bacterium]|nr:hypothetical protein [Anaerolineaceae bacterium]
MKRLFGVFVIITLLSGTISLVLAQTTPATTDITERPMTFELVNEIGRAVPRNMLYNAPMDQYLVVDAYNRMILMDAPTFTTQSVIYESGNYSDFAFSHDGTLLAIAIDQRIELWDTQTGQQVARLTELGQPKRIEAPITFSRDDSLLIFEGVYPAPRSIRIYENQTITVPWVWHIPSALGINTSSFPGRAEAWQFFDYRNGLVIAPDNRLVAALPGRIQVLDADTLDVVFEIPTDRYENDPMNIQFSARDNQIYFQPNNTNTIVQADTQRGVLTEIPLEQPLTESDLELLGGIQLSQQARRIGEGTNDLTNVFLPIYPYQNYGSGRLSVTLIDLIVPPISQGDNIRTLVFIYNESTKFGYFRLTSSGAQQIILSPNEDELVLRLFPGDNERIITYDLNTGQELRSLVPSLRGIGSYSRVRKNRVLAFDRTGDVLVSDFQRYDAQTNAVIVEDLTYSRRFEDFFIAPDNQSIVTRSGNEWRVWDTATREVTRRVVMPLHGSRIAVSQDGYRWLSRITSSTRPEQTGVEIIDLNNGRTAVASVLFDNIPGSSVGAIYPNRAWTQFLVEYTVNPYGDYTPGNQLALYSLESGLVWHIAGDDLPPPERRSYGWVDENKVYITGTGFDGEQPARVYGVDYDRSRLPQCIVDTFPEKLDEWGLLWENRLYYLRNDQLNNLATLICREQPQTVTQAEQLLVPTATLLPMTVTPIVIPGVPVCLTIAYANNLDAYVPIWNDMVAGLDQAQRDEMEAIVCEGLGDPRLPLYRPGDSQQSYTQTMFVDATTGERSTGAFEPEERVGRPIQPVIEAFQKQYDRSPGQVVLSTDGSLIATSNLPGELIVYRIIDGYEAIMVNVTATAVALQESRNWVYPQPSATPQFNYVGTPRPTLTPTPAPTAMPLPDPLQLEHSGETERLCPSETLYTPDNLPDGWTPSGTIATQIQGEVLWRVNPITGARFPDETLPQCFVGVDCSFSPDNQWILGNTLDTTYVVRPDGTDSRGLWNSKDLEDGVQDYPFLYRTNLSWWNGNTLQWQTTGYDDRGYRHTYINRDILGVFPDPDPFPIEDIVINNIVAERAYEITASEWVVARIPFSTGTGLIYQYYLYNLANHDWVMFARQPDVSFSQDALGTRLFYSYFRRNNRIPVWNQIRLESVSADSYAANELPSYTGGVWSLDGRYRIGAIDSRAYPLQLWDSQTGLVREYCIPETGARLYQGSFTWSTDGRYVALRAPLPKDESAEGVGQHLLVLDIETGAMVDVTTGTSDSMFWVAENYE